MMFGNQGQPGGHPLMSPSAMSPRMGNFTPGGHVPFGFGGPPPGMQQPPQQLQPSALPRNFNNNGPTPFDHAFQRVPVGLPSVGVPSPIGPPSKPKTPMAGGGGSSGSPTTPGGPGTAGGPPPPPLAGRRSVHALTDAPGGGSGTTTTTGAGGPPNLGPISRPIAPIARPMGPTSAASGDNSSPGSNSPVRRSPSLKGVLLGSSALAADDDEVVPSAGRRQQTGTAPIGIGSGVGMGSGVGVGVNVGMGGGGAGPGMIGQHWGPSSPRGGVGDNMARSTPWGPPPGFSAAPGARPPPPPPIGPPPPGANHNHNHNHTNQMQQHPIGHPHPPSHHPQHHPPGAPPPPGSAGAASLWGAPTAQAGVTPDWHSGSSGVPPFFGGAGPFMNHNAPGSPSPHSAGGAGGNGGNGGGA
jgi:hypothetical protein